MKKNLVILAESYPYSKSGDGCFIEKELGALEKNFDKISVISVTDKSELCYDVGKLHKISNTKLSRFTKLRLKLASIFRLLTPKTFKEIKLAYKYMHTFEHKLSFMKILRAIASYYFSAKVIKKKLTKMFDKTELKNTVFYTYWLAQSAFAIAELRRRKKIGFAVSRAHRYDCSLEQRYLPFRRFLDENLDAVYFISDNKQKDYLEGLSKLFVCHDEKYKLYRLGVKNKQVFKSRPASDTLNIVSCSHVIRLKRLDLIIDSLALINDIHINWVHFGDGIVFEEMKSRAVERLSEKANIAYEFKGRTDNNRIIEYYQSNDVDLLINMSDDEGIPVSIMEAQEFGIISVGRDVGGMSEIVLPEFIVSDKPEEIAQKIEEYYFFDDAKKNELRKRAFETIARNFNSDINTQAFCDDLYEKAKITK